MQVEGVVIADGVEEQQVVFSGEAAFAAAAGAVTPDDFVAEVVAAEDGVEEGLEVVAGGGIAVEVEAAVGAEDAVAFHEANAEPDEEGGHVVAGGGAGAVDDGPDGGPVVLDAVEPVGVDVAVPAPAVLEAGAGGEAVGVAWKSRFLLKGRVGGDELDSGAVHTAEEVQVIAVVEGAIGEVGGGHGDSSPGAVTAPMIPAAGRCGQRPAAGRKGKVGSANEAGRAKREHL